MIEVLLILIFYILYKRYEGTDLYCERWVNKNMNLTEILEKASHYNLIDYNWNYNKTTKVLIFEEYAYCFYVDNNENVLSVGIYFKDEPATEIIYKNDNNDEEKWITHIFSSEVRAVLTNYWYAKHGFYFEDGRVYGS